MKILYKFRYIKIRENENHCEASEIKDDEKYKKNLIFWAKKKT